MSGAVKEVSVVVASMREVRCMTSLPIEVMLLGENAVRAKVAGLSCNAWKVVVAFVVVAKSGGTERVREEMVRVLVAVGEASAVEVAMIEALPVHPPVVVVMILLVEVA